MSGRLDMQRFYAETKSLQTLIVSIRPLFSCWLLLLMSPDAQA